MCENIIQLNDRMAKKKRSITYHSLMLAKLRNTITLRMSQNDISCIPSVACIGSFLRYCSCVHNVYFHVCVFMAGLAKGIRSIIMVEYLFCLCVYQLVRPLKKKKKRTDPAAGHLLPSNNNVRLILRIVKLFTPFMSR